MKDNKDKEEAQKEDFESLEYQGTVKNKNFGVGHWSLRGFLS